VIGWARASENTPSYVTESKYRDDLCGKIHKIDCGNGPLDIIITNSN
jgi:hypothetical protein